MHKRFKFSLIISKIFFITSLIYSPCDLTDLKSVSYAKDILILQKTRPTLFDPIDQRLSFTVVQKKFNRVLFIV